MPNVCDKSNTLTKSLAAVSLAIVGRANEDEALIKRSFEVYGYALRELQKTLLRKQTQSNQNTLAAMMALKTYEVFQQELFGGVKLTAYSYGNQLSHLAMVGWPMCKVRRESYKVEDL